jgi:hypothetical protein
MMKQHDQQVLTAMQPVIDILEKEYLEAEEVLRSTGKYGWLAEDDMYPVTVSNNPSGQSGLAEYDELYYIKYPSKAFTVWTE